MSDLDDDLRLKLKALVFDEWDYEDFLKEGLGSYVTAIKQAFADAGYSTFRDRDGLKFQTGQMFLDNFVKEFELFGGEDGAIMNAHVVEAVKRAAGIDNA